MAIFNKIKQGLIKTNVIQEKQEIKSNLIESSIEINYSESLSFLRENKNPLSKTEALISVLETLQAASHHYTTSEAINKEQVFFQCIYTSAVDVQKAIKELAPLITLVPYGELIMIILELMMEYRKELNLENNK